MRAIQNILQEGFHLINIDTKKIKIKKNSNNKYNVGLPLINKRPRSVFTAQPELIKGGKMKGNDIQNKVHLSGYTQGQHMWTSATRDVIEK